MTLKGIQQIMLGKVTRTEEETFDTLTAIAMAGYDGIELNGFMIRPTSIFVRMLTGAAGMPAGNGGRYDWPGLVKAAGLSVISVHEDLGTIRKDPDAVIREAKSFSCDKVVITGMYRFDYSDGEAVSGLCTDLNTYGKILRSSGIRLLYHNHNAELLRVNGETAYERIIRSTDPAFVNFEFDSYWFTESGANAVKWMEKLGSRMKLWHINDRGVVKKGPAFTPIVESDSRELGYGTMDLDTLSVKAKQYGIEAVILESHRNHAGGSALKSMALSAEYLNRTFG